MVSKTSKYRRLPGRPPTFLGTRSLWQGSDHLLWVESVFFKERYKRFFYSDIQSIVLLRTDTHLLWAFIWGAPALICGLIAFLVSGTPYVSATLTVLFLMAFGINAVLGASCNVFLQTAAQVQKIASLRRIKTAQIVMDRIKEQVLAAQGAFERPSRPGAQFDAIASPGPRPAAADIHADAQNDIKQKPAADPFAPLLHHSLFGILLALGILGAIQLLAKNLPVAILETLLHGVAQIMAIIVVVRWHRHLKGTFIAKVSWLALVIVTLETIIGYGFFIAASVTNPQINYNHWALFKKVFELQWGDHPFLWAGNLLYAGVSLLLGICGLMMMRRRQWIPKSMPAS